MENVYDIKQTEKLEYIFPVDDKEKILPSNLKSKKVAVILYLYYEDTIESYYKYLIDIARQIPVYIISSSDSVILKTEKFILRTGLRIEIIKKPNEGRDISGLLIAAKEIVSRNEIVCFLHDKKAHNQEMEEDTKFWVKNIWNNLIGSVGYVGEILKLFEKEKKLGVLAPPAPIGRHFCAWYGYGWHDSFEVTKQLAQQLHLKCNLNKDKPPITLGTAIWFRTEALIKLFDYPWKYENFDDSQLISANYISYGIERIFAYVAQDAGFTTGEVMTQEYAREQTLFLQCNMTELFKYIQQYFPFPTLNSAMKIDSNIEKLLQYVKSKKKVYLYGAGDVGRFCLSILRKHGILPCCFLVSEETEKQMVDGMKVISIRSLPQLSPEEGVIIAVVKDRVQDEIKSILTEAGIQDSYIFWQEK